MRRIFTLLSLVALAVLAGCGGGSSSANPPGSPSGGNNAGYSLSSFKGTYVISANGVDGAGYSLAVLGSFVADGAGNVTSGARDLYSSSGAKVTEEAVTGTYSVNQDGRGQLQLKGASGTATYRFVMRGNGEGVFFQYSGSKDDTGHFVPVPSTMNPAQLAATQVLHLDGEDKSGAPYGAIGLLTVSGTSVTGVVDQNDAGTFSGQLPATGTLATPDANLRGTLTLTIGGTAHSFAYYWVSAGQLELASTDGVLLYGQAQAQTSVSGSVAAFAGGQAFSLNGYFASGSTTYPMMETGRFTLDGAGNVTSAVEDYNVGGSYIGNSSFSGTYTADATGHWSAPLTARAGTIVGYQVSPTQSVLLSYNATATILQTGTLRAQSTALTTSSFTGNYAVDYSGYNYGLNGNVETGANYLADGAGNLTGTMDSQTPGYYNADISETGQYAISSSGRSTATVAGVPMLAYAVDASTAYLISSDTNRLYQGKMVKQ